MIRFVSIVCNGRLEEMTTTSSVLTWFEEWLLFFQWSAGGSEMVRKHLAFDYKIHVDVLDNVLRRKLDMCLTARKSWPMFVDMHEDELLRDSVKWSAYAGKRVIEWDNSDVKVCVYENPLYQRNTYSKYYGGNCAKGAVFLQPCGWIGTTELWTGHISDTDYMERNKIFQLQEEFVQSCQDPKIPFTNILDRGYRVALSAWKTGKKL